MRLGRLGWSAVIFVPLLLVCGSRLYGQRSGSPQGMTQEVNRCLTVIRVAAARRKGGRGVKQRPSSSVASDGTAA